MNICFQIVLIVECFQAKGASIGDIFIISGCAFHDRRIPIPVSVIISLDSSGFLSFILFSIWKCSWLCHVFI